MDRVDNDDWKNNFEFKINYKSDQSTDDDDLSEGVVLRAARGRVSAGALADEGDAADLLGSTPPRARIRNKEKRRSVLESEGRRGEARRPTQSVMVPSSLVPQDRLKKRLSLKMVRSKERDWKQEYGSLPSPGTTAAPPVVESCNRFMSLSSWLKCRRPDEPPAEPRGAAGAGGGGGGGGGGGTGGGGAGGGGTGGGGASGGGTGVGGGGGDGEVPESRVTFHNTFCMLINMGNVDKACKRTISREEQVWQNDLKDMIWLELQARLAGRELAAHDAWLVARRAHLPALLQRILTYRFENPYPCPNSSQSDDSADGDSQLTWAGCAALACGACAAGAAACGAALAALLDALHAASALYPSSRAMARDHPLLAAAPLQARLHAMSLWYNTATHLRLKLAAVLRLLRSLEPRLDRVDRVARRGSVDSEQEENRSDSDTCQTHDADDDQNRCSKEDEDNRESETDDQDSEVQPGSAGRDSGYLSGPEPLPAAALHSLARLALLDACRPSPFREYHTEILKTQGVRRCMMFMNTMRRNLLLNAYLTLEAPDAEIESLVGGELGPDAAARARDIQRYGCWSEESLAMALPSYRNHFLLLNCLCMEVVHDYLSLRIEGRPQQPSCLTIKQLIHELKEGLDIATEMREVFARNVCAALRGRRVAAPHLRLLLRNYDATVRALLDQYVSYVLTMSRVELLPRAALHREWAFAAALAARRRAPRAPHAAFAEIACNQLDLLVTQFNDKFKQLEETHNNDDNIGSKEWIYGVCREAQSVFVQQREATLQAAQWARALAGRLAGRGLLGPRAAVLAAALRLRRTLLRHLLLLRQRARALDAADAAAPRVRELLLQAYRLAFEVHKELHAFVQEGEAGAGSRARVGGGAGGSGGGGRARLLRADSLLGEDVLPPPRQPAHRQMTVERLLGLEEVSSSEEEDAADPDADQREGEREVAHAVVDLARSWMSFVLEKCERGRGRRPRWASHGLDFLVLACDPSNTKHLTDEEFEELKQLMDGCISHVVGSRARAPSPPRARPRRPQPTPPTPQTPPADADPVLVFAAAPASAHERRVRAAVRALEAARGAARAGRVVARAPRDEPPLRRLSFKWQRGLKIGAGTFGKVYTVVNTATGQLLAMKELRVGPGEGEVRRAARELRLLEGVAHPHLVAQYGCEVQRDKLLIFMELCVEGSLEALLAAGALGEAAVRRYSRQLLSALTELHARGIVHRDIKPANVFLTGDGHCLKLGDFGSAVKIRASHTAPGELRGFVGTQAYMAPEVFMRAGHGRAADIWSLGCLVAEMASGERPFAEYDSNYQIMFVVGMGGRPRVPDSLSEEGRDFLELCLAHEPDLRPRAIQLAAHTFLMVKSDDDCKCEPSYLKT